MGDKLSRKMANLWRSFFQKNEFDKLKGPAKSLIEFFKDAPFQETELDIQSIKDYPRELDL
jgi:hypothetical protein